MDGRLTETDVLEIEVISLRRHRSPRAELKLSCSFNGSFQVYFESSFKEFPDVGNTGT